MLQNVDADFITDADANDVTLNYFGITQMKLKSPKNKNED